jgi:DNA-directed RNA polymerase specialized sigma24 family protein
LQLVLDARAGHQESLGELAEMAQGRLLSYIYRLTLDYDLTQELCQQTLVKMVERIAQLRQADRFWFWLFRTASGEVQHYYRSERKEEKVRVAALNKRQ